MSAASVTLAFTLMLALGLCVTHVGFIMETTKIYNHCINGRVATRSVRR